MPAPPLESKPAMVSAVQGEAPRLGSRSFESASPARRRSTSFSVGSTTRASLRWLRRKSTAPMRVPFLNAPFPLVHLVGDVMYDAVLYYGESDVGAGALFERLGILEKAYVLVTVHRAENTDEPPRLSAIVAGLCEIAEDLPVVLPLHPRTRGALEQTGLLTAASRALKLIEPVGYLDMLLLERHARLIATDSGGIQKEAFFHRVPCVTLRDETEWSEHVDLGWNRLAPPLAASGIAKVIRAALAEPEGQQPPADLYGGGDANRRIAEILTAGGSEGA